MKMDAIQVYAEHFKKKETVIRDLFLQFQAAGCCVALWGGGRRGIAFLQTMDPKGHFVSSVFDSDPNKDGVMLTKYHRIRSADKIKKGKKHAFFLSGDFLEASVRYLCYRLGIDAEIISVDHIIWGDLSAEDVHGINVQEMKPIRRSRICALVILYHPDTITVENVLSYAKDVDKLFLYDNTENGSCFPWKQFETDCPIEYICHKENLGIGTAVNEVAKKAIVEGFDWLITFDQDSRAEKNMLPQMRRFVNSNLFDTDLALVAPFVNDQSSPDFIPSDILPQIPRPHLSYRDRVIQSGSMHNLSIWEELGGYNEALFIQEVDFEFCARCLLKEKKIVQLHGAVLHHQTNDNMTVHRIKEGQDIILGKYTPLSCYYLFRNSMYCVELYRNHVPLFALSCEDMMSMLEKMADLETDQGRIRLALSLAKKDCLCGIMGKIANEKMRMIGW